MKSAVTISLVSEARGGPFVFWDDLPAAVQSAAGLGYDAVELFLPGPDAVNLSEVRRLVADHGLSVAAVGTGAGMVKHRLSLTDPDDARRDQAIAFVKQMIELGGAFQAPAIIGSMQGRWQPEVGKPETLKRLAGALQNLAQHAAQFKVPLIYEPLNRYETNLCVTLAEGVELIKGHGLTNVTLLADLFHMNIEEVSIADALLTAGKYVGHLHFVDSNRRPAGCGHLDFSPIAAALREIQYTGYASAEAFPWPDSEQAASQTMKTYRQLFSA